MTQIPKEAFTVIMYTETLLDGCLYFSANRIARLLTKMAEEEFAVTTLPPTYGF